MSTPPGGPSWPPEPQPPSSGAGSGAQPDPRYGPPGGAPQGSPEGSPYAPPSGSGYGPPAGSPYGPPAGSPYDAGSPYGQPAPGYPPGPYGAPPPSGPPKSNKGLIIGLVIGAVVLLLCIGGGVLTAVLVAQSDPSTSPTVASSNPTTTAPTGSPTNGGTHTRFTNSCAPVAGALAANGLALPEPRANDSDIGPTELFFCSGSLTKAGARSGYLSVTAVLYDDFAGRTAAERGMRGHEADRKADETAGGTVTDVSGVGEKAYMVTRMSGGQVISVQIAAVDNNLNVSARITLDDLTLSEATKVATDIVKAYIAA